MKRVLVVERDSLQRELIREWLARGRCQVAVAGGARSPRRADIDAILVDVTCQQQAHANLASWRSAHPRAAIVLASGRFSRRTWPMMPWRPRFGVTRILAKPFTREDLWAALGLPHRSADRHPPPR